MTAPQPARANYGQDAPGVVRNLIIAAAVGLAIWATTLAKLWSGVVRVGPVAFQLGPMGLVTACICGGLAAWMIWSSRIGKVRDRERLLDLVPWTGGERVLDVGCGRGLMLIGAAKRLTSGRAVGIDIWQTQDLAGNSSQATLDNARLEQVAERVEVHTADMRTMPFPDGSFDVIVSSNAIHNLYKPPERAAALKEIARVLKPGGSVVIDDIRHLREYARLLREQGCAETRLLGSKLVALVLAILTVGSLRPAVVLARKAA
jgi:ubiquinone/menaquinone biosynthesis C-methylase UbiE